ncbi:hypothetical protein [Prochlorothrix hollandica]|uniref:hypothetical protein n=1 Tax=Prochlorothrix hollandica TaxID=1223 RepID=UPI00034CA9DF|nr:hypothetical protein [Prochlorothrix hollandica]
MHQLNCCASCHYYARNPNIVCALHPAGQSQGYCADYQQGELPLAVAWASQGTTPEDDPSGDPVQVAQRRQHLLDWHPLFTGRCPECEMPIADPGVPHWDCSHCGWGYDSPQL